MKKLLLLFYVLTGISFISCMDTDSGDSSLTFTETENNYSMDAYFDQGKMRDVEQYLDRKIGRRSHISFVNLRHDGQLALDDNTKFYIKKYRGHIEINLDKDENSEEAYHKIKDMCEGIKSVLKGRD